MAEKETLEHALGRIEQKIDNNRTEMVRLGTELLRDRDASILSDEKIEARLRVLENELTRQKTIAVVISGIVSFFVVAAGVFVDIIARVFKI